MSQTHPESLKEINAVKISDEIREFVNTLARDIEDEKNNRRLWEQRVDQYRNLRYGFRAAKDFPWADASNLVIPLIDADIQRLKPSYVNMAYAVNPIVTFEPYGPEDIEPSRLKEQLFDWRMRTKVNFFPPYVTGIDRMLEQGQVVFKTTWKFSTRNYEESLDVADFPEDVQRALYDVRVSDEMLFEIIQEELKIDLEHEENVDAINDAIEEFRGGKTDITLNLTETEDNQPEVIVCDLREDLMVPVDTLDLNDARFIDYLFPITINNLKIGMRDGKYEQYEDHEIQEWAGKAPRDRLNTLQDDPNEIVWLHETCVWKDINKDGIEERCITTFPDASPNQVLRFIENPYDHGQWCYTQVKRELTDPGFYVSRGIPELDFDFQMAITTFTNQAVDNGTITNTPQRVYRKGALVNKNNMRYVPGEDVELNTSLADYELRQGANISQPGLLQMAQYMKQWADQRLGNQTSGVSGDQNLPGSGSGGKKTKAEIDLISSMAGQTQSLDLQIFQQQMAKLYYQIDALYDQFGDDEETLLVTGQEPVTISRREIQGKFNIVPNGRLDNSDPGRRLQKLMFAMQVGVQSPYVKQKELIEEVYENIDPRLADLVMKSDQELQLEAQQQAMAIENQKMKTANEQLALKKAVDDTDIRKEFLMTPITGAKFKKD